MPRKRPQRGQQPQAAGFAAAPPFRPPGQHRGQGDSHRSSMSSDLSQEDFPSLAEARSSPQRSRDRGFAMSPYPQQPIQQTSRQPPTQYFYRNDQMQPQAYQQQRQFTQNNQRPDQNTIASMAKTCIEQLAEAGKYVSVERIEKLLLQRLNVTSLRAVNIHRLENLDPVKEHVRLLNKVNTYIQAFIQVSSVCSLHQLHKNLTELDGESSGFEALKLGPIQKLPAIYDMFKFPPDVTEIPPITAPEILQHLREYLTENNMWTEKVEFEPFMDYLVKKYGVESAYYLGVRIRSMPLAIQMLKTAQRHAGSSRRAVVEELKKNLQEEIDGALQRFRGYVFRPTATEDPGLEISQHYLSMNPPAVIAEIFGKFQMLFSVPQFEGNDSARKLRKLEHSISEFLKLIQNDALAARLFYLAVCVSAIDLQKDLMTPPESSGMNEESGEDLVQQPPPLDQILQKLQSYLDRCLTHGSVTLNDMQKIEEHLLRDFNFPSFQSMGIRSFLWFLLHQPDAKKLLEVNCGLSLGSSASSTASSGFRPSYSDVLELIKQSKNAGVTENVELEAILCSQFHVQELRQLGYGMIDRLKKAQSKSQRHQSRESNVVYEATLFPTNKIFSSKGKVGILGHQTRDTARACLHNCPMMENLSDWSYWPLVFEPELGPLKEFIQKYGGTNRFEIEDGRKVITTDFVAMETEPGHMIKLVSQTSVEKFAEAVKRADVIQTCGHLLSQIVASKSVGKTHLALLANHLKTALFTLNSASTERMPGGPPTNQTTPNKAIMFVLECLHKLPIKTTVTLANEMFLSPLGEVVGKKQSKVLLLQMAKSNSEYMSRLIQLGCVLGIQEWTEPLETRCQFSVDCIVNTASVSLDQEQDSIDISREISEKLNVANESEESDTSSSSEDSDSSSEDESEENGTKEEVKEISPVTDSSMKEGDSLSTSTEEEGESGEVTESSSESREEPENKHKALIDEIRREKFGVGLELSEDGEKLMKVQQGIIGRSLDGLSKELYSKDTHFVLELVQNADDNDYPVENGESIPTVEFEIQADRIAVRNNECGFIEKNIRAVCDVGRSTKGKHKYGYIGQKGIGFKSVFRVTDSPEIHSNGFHIKFDVKSGPIGYILPHWADPDSLDDKWMTQIILPFKDDVQTQTLAARFSDIHPSLLLFLHRLRQITIVNKMEKRTLTMRRHDLSDNVVEIEHTDSTDRWLVVKKILDASEISLQAKSGVDVESTEIALAFPINASKQRAFSQSLPPKQDVFAFLPLHSYGFRFIIQGDFDVPSSREDVVKDSAWNQWLRNEIPALFIEAFSAFKNHKDFSLMEAIFYYLQLVPSEDEILDFFQPVASQILNKLRGKNFIPTHPNSKDEVFLKKPCQVVTTSDSLVKEVVNADLLQKHLNLYYLHGDLAAVLNHSHMTTLGIETVTAQHLLQVGKELSLSLRSGPGPEFEADMHQVSKWLACVFRSIDDLHPPAEVLSSLKTMDIIPLSGGEFTSLEKHTVFFAIEQFHRKGRQSTPDPFQILQTDLCAIHPGLLNTTDKVVNSQVERLLQMLDVKSLTPSEVISHYIMPTLRSDVWKEKSRDLLVSYVLYIKRETEKNPSLVNLEELKSVVPLLTNKELQNPANVPIHFSPLYGNTVNLPALFPGYNWVMLDSAYLVGLTQKSEVQQMHDFFIKLGVTDSFAIKREKVQLTPKTLEDSLWKSFKEMWPMSQGGYVIEDYCCEEVRKLILENSHRENYHQQMTELAELLDRDWDALYSKFQTVSVNDTEGRRLLDSQSSFSILLHTSSWLPGNVRKLVGMEHGPVQLQKTDVLMRPCELYLFDQHIQDLLFYTVPYMNVNLSKKSSFMTFLKVKTTVDAKMIQDLLIGWSRRENPEEPAKFCTTIKHIKTVYRFLFERLSPKDIKALFNEHAIIYVPLNPKMNNEALNPKMNNEALQFGSMLFRDEVWWKDPTGLFAKRHTYLEDVHSHLAKKRLLCEVYFDMEHCFVGHSGHIQLQPTPSEYAELWIHISETDVLRKDSQALRDVLRLMAFIGNSLQTAELQALTTDKFLVLQEKNKIVQMLKDRKIFATKRNVWVSLAQHPLIPDNPQLEKLFQDKEDVHFVNLQEESAPTDRRRKAKDTSGDDAIKWLLMSLGVTPISACASAEEASEFSKPSPELQMFMHQVVPYIQRYLYCHFTDDIYQQHVIKNMKNSLLTMAFYKVKTLEVVYSLRHSPMTTVRQEEHCLFDQSSNAFSFQVDKIHKSSLLNEEIAKMFSLNNKQCFKGLRSFLLELTSKYPVLDNTENILSIHDVVELPEFEPVWEVPRPIIQAPPPPKQTFIIDVTENDTGNTAPPPGDNVLRAWPPKSSSAPQGSRPFAQKEGEDRPKSNVWPPPKPPDYMNVTDLPPQFQQQRAAGDTKGVPHPQRDPTTRGPSDGTGDRKSHGLPPSAEQKDQGSENQNTDQSGKVSQGVAQGRQSSQEGGQTSGGHGPQQTGSTPQQTGSTAQQAGAPSQEDGPTSQHGNQSTEQGVRNLSDEEQTVSQSEEKTLSNNAPTPEGAGEQTTGMSGAQVGRENSPLGRKRLPPGEISTPSPKKSSLQLSTPIWDEKTMVVEMYEEIGNSLNLPFPDDCEMDDTGQIKDIGDWGERLVRDYLAHLQANDPSILYVQWSKETGNIANPYDFELTIQTDEGKKSIYIEVKATISSAKEMFEISFQELDFAFHHQDNYLIYRLYGAGSRDNVRLVKIQNVAFHLNRKSLRLCMVV